MAFLPSTSLTRRHFFFGALAAPALAQKKRTAVQRPNILLILADGLASWTLGCYGNKEIHTPNIDRLAQTGMRFAHHFVCTPAGSASRATLFTGRTPRQTGVADFLTPQPVEKPPQGQAAPPPAFAREIMLPDILSGQGYHCGYVGKWHMGDDEKPQHACKFWYTMAGAAQPYQNPQMSWNGEPVHEKGYLADLLTAKACQFFDQQNPGTPFFLTVAYPNPHPPYEGHPQKYYDMYAGARFESFGYEPMARNALRGRDMFPDFLGNLQRFAAAVTALDDQMPVLLEKVRSRGLLDNTLVLFTSSHGQLLGRHGLWSGGLASDPINMYEEAVSVPMIWSWLGRVPPQNVRPELVSLYDLLPALCEAAGAPLPAGRNLCGRSYTTLARNQKLPKNQPWRNLVFGDLRNTSMVRDARYKVILRNEGRGPHELYDLTADAREKVNQYDNPQYVSVRDRMSAEMAKWLKQHAA
jgi:arylsulfatase A-like enzyme